MILTYRSDLINNLLHSTETNAGLVFERYLDLWEMRNGGIERKKLETPLNNFVNIFNSRGKKKHDADMKMLFDFHDRQKRAIQSMRSYSLTASVRWRLVVGMGNPHPSENGFTFDPLIGVPILPGSSAKGMCRQTASLMDIDEPEVAKLFGPDDLSGDPKDAFAGDIVFLDTYPVKWPKLCVDIINCHHSAYYGDLEKKTGHSKPVETESPSPVFFIAVDKGTEFCFRIFSRGQSERDLKKAADILRNSLDLFGIGAKTALGYGNFKVDNSMDVLGKL